MKLLFLTPVMGNWVRWGAKHIAANPLHAQLTAYIREKKSPTPPFSIAGR